MMGDFVAVIIKIIIKRLTTTSLTITTTTLTNIQRSPTPVYSQNIHSTQIYTSAINTSSASNSFNQSSFHSNSASFGSGPSQQPDCTLNQLMQFMRVNFEHINRNIAQTNKNITSSFNATINSMQQKYDKSFGEIFSRLDTLESRPSQVFNQVTSDDNDFIDKISVEILNRQNKALNLVLFGLHEFTDLQQDNLAIKDIIIKLKLNPSQTKFNRVGIFSAQKT